MNRFTKDMATIDDMLPLVLFDLIQVGLGLIHTHTSYTWCYTNVYTTTTTTTTTPVLVLLRYDLKRPPHGRFSRPLTSFVVYKKYNT